MAQSIEGGVVVVNTLSTKNDGDYPLVMAESVGLSDGGTVEEKLKDLETGSNVETISEEEIAAIFNE